MNESSCTWSLWTMNTLFFLLFYLFCFSSKFYLTYEFFHQTFMYRQPFASIIHILTHIDNSGKNEWTFPDDSVGSSVSVDAWLSLSINVTVNQMMSPHHQTHKEPVELKWQQTLHLLANRPKLCNNCSTLMNSNPELLNSMISKQRDYFSVKYSLRFFFFLFKKSTIR